MTWNRLRAMQGKLHSTSKNTWMLETSKTGVSGIHFFALILGPLTETGNPAYQVTLFTC